MKSWPTVRLYCVVPFISIFIGGPILICAFYPNTSEATLQSFIQQSELISNDTNSWKQSFLWGFFLTEMFLSALCGTIFCLLTSSLISNMNFMKLVIPLLRIPAYAAQLLSKMLNQPVLLFIGRFMSLVGFGIVGVVIPVFLTEISGTKNDSAITVYRVYCMFLPISATIFGHRAVFGTDDRWHMVFTVLLAMSVLGLLGMFLVPDSPAYLLTKKENVKAEKSFSFYQGVEELDLKHMTQLASETKHKYELRQLGPVAVVALLVTLCAQRCGHLELFLYSTAIFDTLGFDNQTSQTLSVASKIPLILSVFYPYLVSKISRRTNFLVTGAIPAACYSFLSLAAANLIPIGPITQWIYVSVVSVCMLSSDLNLALYYIIVPEVFPYEYRVKAKSLTLFLLYSLTMISTLTMYPALQSIGMIMFLFQAIPLWIFVVALWKLMPETKGKISTEEIMKEFKIILDEKDENRNEKEGYPSYE